MSEWRKRAIVIAVALLVGGAAAASTAAARQSEPPELPATLPNRTLRVPILMYHRIARDNPSLPAMTRRLTVDPRVFAAQMRWLDRNGFTTITQRQLFDALFRGRPLPRKPVLLTFDDGYRNVWGQASPVLAALRMRATAYVVTGRISGPDPSFLTWEQLRLLENRGIEVASHTVSHRALTSLSDAQLAAELRTSRAALERALGHEVRWFAYPFGAHDRRVVAAVRRAGYLLATTTVSGDEQSARAPFELRRLSVANTTGVAGLASMLR